MKWNRILLGGVLSLLLFASCKKDIVPSSVSATDKATLDAKMVAYGFKPFVGSMDTVTPMPSMTFEHFDSTMQKLKAVSLRFQSTRKVQSIRKMQSTSKNEVAPADVFGDMAFITWGHTNDPAIDDHLVFTYPNLAQVGANVGIPFPYVFTVVFQGTPDAQPPVVTSYFGRGPFQNNGYRHTDGIPEGGNFGLDFYYLVEGFLVVVVSVDGGQYTARYYVHNDISGVFSAPTGFLVQSTIILDEG